ncbi:MAG: FecR family protein [Myxococcota bacterium]|nr:FecR family protein [Myxococcota bacterium]
MSQSGLARSNTKALILEVTGSAWIQQPGATSEHSAHARSYIPFGSAIRTGLKGRLSLRLPNETVLNIRPDSKIVLVSRQVGQKTTRNSLVLLFGRVWSQVVKRMGGEEHYRIVTSNAVAGVRGTEFEVAVADDGRARIYVDSGSVSVRTQENEALLQSGGDSIINQRGEREKETNASKQEPKWNNWFSTCRRRLKTTAPKLIQIARINVHTHRVGISKIRNEQEHIVGKEKRLQSRARMGDARATQERQKLKAQLRLQKTALFERQLLLNAQMGIVDRYADLANDPKFGMLDRTTIIREAKFLRRLKASLDKTIQDGMDISLKAMESLMNDMGRGKRDSLNDSKDSAVDEMFGPDKGRLDIP